MTNIFVTSSYIIYYLPNLDKENETSSYIFYSGSFENPTERNGHRPKVLNLKQKDINKDLVQKNKCLRKLLPINCIYICI